MREPTSIIAELEAAVRSGSSGKRVSALRQITDLFLHDGERLSDDQVKVFDNRLIKQRINEATLKIALRDYEKLSAETAERTLRFWQLHDKLEK